MKKRIFSFLTMLLFTGISNVALAEDTDISALANAIYIEKFEAGIGKQVVISLKMKNSGDIRGYQCDLYLPNGMSFAKDSNGDPIAEISGGRATTNHTLTPTIIQSDDALRLLCSALQDKYFSGNDGEIAQVTVDVSSDMPAGDYTITLKNIKMGPTANPEDGTNIDEINSTVTVVVQDYDVLLDEASTTVPENSDGAVKVKVLRTLNAGNWSTICLPFAMTESQVKAAFGDDVSLADFTGYKTEEDADGDIIGITINFNNVALNGGFEKDHPYLIKVSNNITEFTVDNVTINSEDTPCVALGTTTGKGNKAVYHPMDFTGTYVADFDFYADAQSRAIFISNNKFYYATESTKKMKAFRAYFDFDDVLNSIEAASARIKMSVTDGDGNTTEIKNADFVPVVSGRVYSINGQNMGEADQMNNLPKGIYIVNGKKVIK